MISGEIVAYIRPDFPNSGSVNLAELALLWVQLGLPFALLARTDFCQLLLPVDRRLLVRSYLLLKEDRINGDL